MNTFTVYLSDLRHNYQGYMSSDSMPLGVALMKAVMDEQFKEANLHSEIFALPISLEVALNDKLPDVLMMTNYAWNENLSYHFIKKVKELNPKCLTVMGGPNFPIETNKRIQFMKDKPALDIYCTGEGDFYASELVQLFIDSGCNIKTLLEKEIHSSVYEKNGKMVITDMKPRMKDLDTIPSPWLNGVLDKYFDGSMVPLYETNRGCPFSCTFCVNGSKWYNKINYFSLERIHKEILYIANKTNKEAPQLKVLRIADLNFGMYPRDVDVASYIGEAQKLYHYPLVIDATTGKNKADNIIKTMEKVNGALVMYQAVQSLDDEVLENIQRSNIKLETYKDIQIYVKGRGLKSSSDLILGLPGETLIKHLKSLEKLVNAGTNSLNNFQSMLLKGAEMETQASRDKYQFLTKFRLLPKSYGVYMGNLVLDGEEIVVGSKDLDFEEYLLARRYHLIINLFWNYTRFNDFVEIIKQVGYTPWQWIEQLKVIIDNKNYTIIKDFEQETKTELFDSMDDLREFYSIPENIKRLNSSEIGDNLIYKYRTLGLFYYWDDIVEIALTATIQLLKDKNVEEVLNQYALYIKNNYVHGKKQDEIFKTDESSFDFDIKKWREDGFSLKNAKGKYKLDSKKLNIKFQLSKEKEENLKATLKIWSFDPKSFSMFIRRIHNDWLEKDTQFIYE